MDNKSWTPVIRGYPIDAFYASRSDSRRTPRHSTDAEPLLRRLLGKLRRAS